MSKGLLGIKLGMTQVFNDRGEVVPVTAIAAGPCQVIQVKTVEKDGYNAIQLGFMPQKEQRVNKPLKGHFDKAGTQPYKYVREFRVKDPSQYEVGQEVDVELFAEGEKIDVVGITKGKGFAGVIKRHGFRRGATTHGSDYHRRTGSLAAKGPARVFKGRKMPGHMGVDRVTVQNMEVVRSDKERNLLLVKGAVPGPRKGLVIIKEAVKAAQ
ncbi:MAG TPA: 50S ribosomal protein L3 [Clostridia bacterium]|jgi:large subunit ribosomal protein L3|nr:50S ribosomal protein L3 [Clostridia bacterium]